MDLRKIFSPSFASEHLSSKQGLSHRAAPGFLNAGGNDAAGNHEMAPRRDLRSIVARRFMLMNEAHDRIRTQLLAGNSSGIK